MVEAFLTRRRLLGATAGVFVGSTALASGAAGRADAASDDMVANTSATAATSAVDLEEWFANTDNYEGVVDRRGRDEVTVTVGADGNGGSYGFSSAAIRVDPGTTVVWEWTGNGGVHNVVAEDGSFQSEMLSDAGATYERTFDSTGVTRYACLPHKAMGMKGAVLVGDVGTGAPSTSVEPNYSGWFDGVDNFDGTVDRTGEDTVTIAVGIEGNGGHFAFDPPAVRVDPGTTVVWEWAGEGSHDVVDTRTGYDSGVRDTAGATFALSFDSKGISKYACTAHSEQGMRGAIVVGDATGRMEVSPNVLLVGGGLGAALLSPLILGGVMHLHEHRSNKRRRAPPKRHPPARSDSLR